MEINDKFISWNLYKKSGIKQVEFTRQEMENIVIDYVAKVCHHNLTLNQKVDSRMVRHKCFTSFKK